LIEEFYTSEQKYKKTGNDCRGIDIKYLWDKFEMKVNNYNKPIKSKINTFEYFF